jgi:hypothetical protein
MTQPTYLLKKETKPNGDIWFFVAKDGNPISHTWSKSSIMKPQIEQDLDMQRCIDLFHESLFKAKIEVIKELKLDADGVTVLD